jgi:DNA repair exonuclease SbcCD ATPase subunit
MSHPALFARRAAIVLAVALTLGFGFFAIRVASAWTAASAPLAVSPPSVAALQEELDAERARSATLIAEIDRLVADSDQLSAAIGAARTQIEQETTNTAEVSAELDAARKKLGDLEKAIRDARAALARQATVTTTRVTTVTAGEHEDDDENDEDDEDEHEEEDDD